MQSGAELTKADDLGNTPLHLAAASNSKATAQLLFQMGADVNLKNNVLYCTYLSSVQLI